MRIFFLPLFVSATNLDCRFLAQLFQKKQISRVVFKQTNKYSYKIRQQLPIKHTWVYSTTCNLKQNELGGQINWIIRLYKVHPLPVQIICRWQSPLQGNREPDRLWPTTIGPHCNRDMGRDVEDVHQSLQMHNPTCSSKKHEDTTIWV